MHAHDRDCPACGAPAGYYCNRPNGTAQKTPHKARHPRKRDNNRGARPNPNFIQFINKQTGNADSFPKIDDQICAFLGVKPDPDQYYLGWYDTIAFLAAMGKTFDQIREDRYVASQPVLLRILDWLDARYTPSAWAGR